VLNRTAVRVVEGFTDVLVGISAKPARAQCNAGAHAQGTGGGPHADEVAHAELSWRAAIGNPGVASMRPSRVTMTAS
jgi:hypothetical protein